MKKFIVVLLFLGSSLYSVSQDVYYGAKLGLGINHMMTSGLEENIDFKNKSLGMTISTHFGGFVEIPVYDNIAIQPELVYTIKGARLKDSEVDDYKSTLVLKYISLPIMAKYYFRDYVSVLGGGYASYLLSARNVEVNGVFSSTFGSEAAGIDMRKTINPFDAGATLGAEYITQIGYFFNIRYEYSLTNSLKDSDAKMNNGTILLTAGFSFK